MVNRKAQHAGSWYDNNGKRLGLQLQDWLDKAEFKHPAKAVIVPHAGYYYSGATAAWSFKQIQPEKVNKVFIIGPSHHVYLPDCGLPKVDLYETPVGNLKLDLEIINDLRDRLDDVTFIPIMVGSLNENKEKKYAKLLNKYISQEGTIVVVSSDFCHWGKRFRYTNQIGDYNHIYESIEALDREGMDWIEKKDLSGFHEYLSRTKNTICGRMPICLLLACINYAESKGQERS